MTESPTQRPQNSTKIPVEIVSEEEMALIEAAFSLATRSSVPPVSSVQFQRNARSIRSITLLSKRSFSGCSDAGVAGDIEDSCGDLGSTQKRNRVPESLLHRFRARRGLSVTDITATEWCEKQMEYFLTIGKPEATKAMKAGSARHAVLEKEVVKREKLDVESVEDTWAIKIINFIVGANQLLFEGLTRELPLIGFTDGVWMVGVIDEIRLDVTESKRNPTLVETKTRSKATLPSEPQQRNGRLQLMCYKYLWDSLLADKFPSRKFFDFFSLNPNRLLSRDIRDSTSKSGFPAETLDDLVRYLQNTCLMLPPTHDQLLLRYEFQEDHSLLGEHQFAYDSDWIRDNIKRSLEFWRGEREPSYTSDEERWKCRFCQFASTCPMNGSAEGTPN
ncbi:hypothetical protein RJ640_012416 [Escallonia rubra]|uniref:Exonuclease V n=1 Tax=Escallonia rubra TaxID=112253 RepID=A0AA88QGP3_9ASTE|nr:hypothetical protein RJ640_012416 [Escallonia rubra]